jgi:hypothetical protein
LDVFDASLEVAKVELNDHGGPTAVKLLPGRPVIEWGAEMIAQRHDGILLVCGIVAVWLAGMQQPGKGPGLGSFEPSPPQRAKETDGTQERVVFVQL